MTNSSLGSAFFTRKPFHSWVDAAFDGRKTQVLPFVEPRREVLGDHILVNRPGNRWEIHRTEPLLPNVDHEPFPLVTRAKPDATELEMDLVPYEDAGEDDHIAFSCDGEMVQRRAW